MVTRNLCLAAVVNFAPMLHSLRLVQCKECTFRSGKLSDRRRQSKVCKTLAHQAQVTFQQETHGKIQNSNLALRMAGISTQYTLADRMSIVLINVVLNLDIDIYYRFNIHIYIYMTCMRIYIYMYICICVYICIYVYVIFWVHLYCIGYATSMYIPCRTMHIIICKYIYIYIIDIHGLCIFKLICKGLGPIPWVPYGQTLKWTWSSAKYLERLGSMEKHVCFDMLGWLIRDKGRVTGYT